MGTFRVAVVMAGGSGERFWPLSTPQRPKQLLRLTRPDATMLEEALERVAPLVGREGAFVATSEALSPLVRESGIVTEERILGEPARRNTLGCIVNVAAHLIARGLGEATVAIVTADHLIGDADRFRASVEAAMATAETRRALVTIGMPPTRPETGYGYIEVDPAGAEEIAGREVFPARRFREKPSLETAREFLEQGGFYWNGGMFFFTLPTLLEEMDAACPEASDVTRRMAEAIGAGDRAAAVEAFEELPNLSIDYALMEKARRVYVVPADFPWDDVGAWDSLERCFGRDEAGNVCRGRAVLIDTEGCVVVNDDPDQVVGALGVRDLVVVATRDAVLVCPKSEAQRVKEIVARLSP
jgi:mannose-1-phosphate guanylyltransferase